MSNILLQAHRGVASEAPENTMAAFRLAARQGYAIIELDPKVTRDGELVILHDTTVNRTARRNGQPIPEPLPIAELTLKEARELDVGEWFSPDFRGEQIPTLAEVLSFAAETGIMLKLDNVIARFSLEARQKIWAALRATPAHVGVTAPTLEFAAEILSEVPEAVLHYDGPVSEELLRALSVLAAEREPVVWLRLHNQATARNKNKPADPELTALVRRYAKLGIWILDTPEELETARLFGAYIVETTGRLKP